MRFALGKVYAPATFCLNYFAPCEVLNVTQTNTCEYGKEECTFKHFILTRRAGKFFCFFKRLCLSLNLYIRNAFHFGCNVNSQVFVNKGTMQACFYNRKVGSG